MISATPQQIPYKHSLGTASGKFSILVARPNNQPRTRVEINRNSTNKHQEVKIANTNFLMPVAKQKEQCNIWNLPHLKWLAGNHGWNITQLSFHDHLPLECGWSCQGISQPMLNNLHSLTFPWGPQWFVWKWRASVTGGRSGERSVPWFFLKIPLWTPMLKD